jgi:hypothetical protein
MKLLVELNDSLDVQVLTEGAGKEKQYFIEGVFLQGGIKNKNGRLYPVEVLRREVDRYTKEYVDSNRALGELGHPTNPSINLDRVSHKIISLREDGNNIIGRAKIMDTPFGKIVKNLMDEGVKLGVSSRGLGSLQEKDGVKIVCEDFRLITAADIVADPSAPDAFVTNLMENKEWVWENGKLIEREVEVKNIINTTSKKGKLNEENLIKIFEYILSQIKV